MSNIDTSAMTNKSKKKYKSKVIDTSKLNKDISSTNTNNIDVSSSIQFQYIQKSVATNIFNIDRKSNIPKSDNNDVYDENEDDQVNNVDNITKKAVKKSKKSKKSKKYKHIDWNENVIKYVKSRKNRKPAVYKPIKPIPREHFEESDSSISSYEKNASMQVFPKVDSSHCFKTQDSEDIKQDKPIIRDTSKTVFRLTGKNTENSSNSMFGNNTIVDNNDDEKKQKDIFDKSQFKKPSINSIKRTIDKVMDCEQINPREKDMYVVSPDKKCRKIRYSTSKLSQMKYKKSNIIFKNKQSKNSNNNNGIKAKFRKLPSSKYRRQTKKKFKMKNYTIIKPAYRKFILNMLKSNIKNPRQVRNIKKELAAMITEKDCRIANSNPVIIKEEDEVKMEEEEVKEQDIEDINETFDAPTNTIELEKSFRLKLLKARQMRLLASEEKKNEEAFPQTQPVQSECELNQISPLKKSTKTSLKKKDCSVKKFKKFNKKNNKNSLKNFIDEQRKQLSRSNLITVLTNNTANIKKYIPARKPIFPVLRQKPDVVDKTKLIFEKRIKILKKIISRHRVVQGQIEENPQSRDRILFTRKKQLIERIQQLKCVKKSSFSTQIYKEEQKQNNSMFQKKLLSIQDQIVTKKVTPLIFSSSSSSSSKNQEMKSNSKPSTDYKLKSIDDLKKLIINSLKEQNNLNENSTSNSHVRDYERSNSKKRDRIKKNKLAILKEKHLLANKKQLSLSKKESSHPKKRRSHSKKERSHSKKERSRSKKELSLANKERSLIKNKLSLPEKKLGLKKKKLSLVDRQRKSEKKKQQQQQQQKPHPVTGNITYLTHEFPWGRPNYNWWSVDKEGSSRGQIKRQQMISLITYFRGVSPFLLRNSILLL